MGAQSPALGTDNESNILFMTLFASQLVNSLVCLLPGGECPERELECLCFLSLSLCFGKFLLPSLSTGSENSSPSLSFLPSATGSFHCRTGKFCLVLRTANLGCFVVLPEGLHSLSKLRTTDKLPSSPLVLCLKQLSAREYNCACCLFWSVVNFPAREN